MATQFTITCGLDTNGHDVDAKQLILDLAAEAFQAGHTIREAIGRWTLINGDSVEEKTIEVVWLTEEPFDEAWPLVAGVAADYKKGAFQEAVMVTHSEVNATFV